MKEEEGCPQKGDDEMMIIQTIFDHQQSNQQQSGKQNKKNKGGSGARTHDPSVISTMLYRLSYTSHWMIAAPRFSQI